VQRERAHGAHLTRSSKMSAESLLVVCAPVNLLKHIFKLLKTPLIIAVISPQDFDFSMLRQAHIFTKVHLKAANVQYT